MVDIGFVVNSITIMLLTVATGRVVYSCLSARCGVSQIERQKVLRIRSQLDKGKCGLIPQLCRNRKVGLPNTFFFSSKELALDGRITTSKNS